MNKTGDRALDNVTDEFKLEPSLHRPEAGVLTWELTKRVETDPIQYVDVECIPLLYTIFFADAGHDVPRWILLGQVRFRHLVSRVCNFVHTLRI